MSPVKSRSCKVTPGEELRCISNLLISCFVGTVTFFSFANQMTSLKPLCSQATFVAWNGKLEVLWAARSDAQEDADFLTVLGNKQGFHTSEVLG